ncbi:MAG: phosphoenolpyruvate--protein phosphotransferase [Verrucomicrobia bacterium]|nr:phosphoenolpyruvate--protein phosphotransferase [Verrucomicrobiota bacterium]
MASGTGPEQTFKGIAAAPGVSLGRVLIHVENELYVPNYAVDSEDLEGEIKRFELALLETRHEISKIRHQVADRLGEEEAQIFDAHLLVLEDPALIDETITELENNLRNIEYCFQKTSQKYIDAFQRIDDEFIKERLNDIKDVTRRILYNLAGETLKSLESIDAEQIVVSHDFTPSDAAAIPAEYLKGFITEAGSRTSHVVIMAKAASVPAVVGVHNILKTLQNGDEIIIDGFEGVVILNPSEATLYQYGESKKRRDTQELEFLKLSGEPAITKDGEQVIIMSNIEGNNEIPRVLETGSDGIGLYRTEYLFLKTGSFPSEESQFQAYKEVVKSMGDSAVILRTYDLGGDKVLQRKDLVDKEDNPFLGCRAIRFSLLYTEVFKDQLRAMLRASAYGNLKIMFPMVSGLEELHAANQLLDEVKKDLKASKVKFDESIEVGIMIEIPSAAFICDILADHCDFFSIGTNDLMQYMLAVDRGNEQVAHLYEPCHPALLRILKQIVEMSNAKNQPVSICGELAGDPIFVPLLVGLGLRNLSVSPNFVPSLKFLVRKLSVEETQALAEEVMMMSDPDPIFARLKSFHDSKEYGIKGVTNRNR